MLSITLIFVLLQSASIEERAFPGFKYLEKTEMNPTSSPIPAAKPRTDLDPVRIA